MGLQPDARWQDHPCAGSSYDGRSSAKKPWKLLAGTLEDHKTSIRNVRRDGNESVKKAAKEKTISADDEKRANAEIQALTDAQIKHVEDLFKAKEKEVLTI